MNPPLNDSAVLLALADAAVKSAALLALAAVVSLLLRKASAAARHAVWVGALVGVLVLPVLSYSLPAWRVPWLPEWKGEVGSVEREVGSLKGGGWSGKKTAATEATNVSTPLIHPLQLMDQVSTVAPIQLQTQNTKSETSDSSVKSSKLSVESSALHTSPFTLHTFAWVWFVGALLALLPLLAGWWQAARLTRKGRILDSPEWNELLSEVSRALDLRRKIQLRAAAAGVMPFTWGAWRAVVIFPEAAEGWTPSRRRLVLLHELGHVKRHDWLTQTLGALACALYWFNPLAWLATRQLRLEREQACDDLVLRCGPAPRDYAHELLEIAAQSARSRVLNWVAVPVGRPGKLEVRLRAILDGTRNRKTLTRAALLALLALVAAIVIPMAMLKASEGETPRPATKQTAILAPKTAITSPSLPSQVETVIIPLKNAKADEVVKHLQVMQAPPSVFHDPPESPTTFVADQRTNTIIVTTDKANEEIVRNLIAQMDVAPVQISAEIFVLETPEFLHLDARTLDVEKIPTLPNVTVRFNKTVVTGNNQEISATIGQVTNLNDHFPVPMSEDAGMSLTPEVEKDGIHYLVKFSIKHDQNRLVGQLPNPADMTASEVAARKFSGQLPQDAISDEPVPIGPTMMSSGGPTNGWEVHTNGTQFIRSSVAVPSQPVVFDLGDAASAPAGDARKNVAVLVFKVVGATARQAASPSASILPAGLETRDFPLTPAARLHLLGWMNAGYPSEAQDLKHITANDKTPTVPTKDPNLTEFFSKLGVDFSTDAKLEYDGGKMIVTNTPQNLDLLAKILNQYLATPRVEEQISVYDVPENIPLDPNTFDAQKFSKAAGVQELNLFIGKQSTFVGRNLSLYLGGRTFEVTDGVFGVQGINGAAPEVSPDLQLNIQTDTTANGIHYTMKGNFSEPPDGPNAAAKWTENPLELGGVTQNNRPVIFDLTPVKNGRKKIGMVIFTLEDSNNPAASAPSGATYFPSRDMPMLDSGPIGAPAALFDLRQPGAAEALANFTAHVPPGDLVTLAPLPANPSILAATVIISPPNYSWVANTSSSGNGGNDTLWFNDTTATSPGNTVFAQAEEPSGQKSDAATLTGIAFVHSGKYTETTASGAPVPLTFGTPQMTVEVNKSGQDKNGSANKDANASGTLSYSTQPPPATVNPMAGLYVSAPGALGQPRVMWYPSTTSEEDLRQLNEAMQRLNEKQRQSSSTPVTPLVQIRAELHLLEIPESVNIEEIIAQFRADKRPADGVVTWLELYRAEMIMDQIGYLMDGASFTSPEMTLGDGQEANISLDPASKKISVSNGIAARQADDSNTLLLSNLNVSIKAQNAADGIHYSMKGAFKKQALTQTNSNANDAHDLTSSGVIPDGDGRILELGATTPDAAGHARKYIAVLVLKLISLSAMPRQNIRPGTIFSTPTPVPKTIDSPNAPANSTTPTPAMPLPRASSTTPPVDVRQIDPTTVTIYEGAKVITGDTSSAAKDDAAKSLDDKVPVLGDIPLIGRLFQSKNSNSGTDKVPAPPPPPSAPTPPSSRNELLNDVITKWAQTDPAAAMTWVQSLPKNDDELQKLINTWTQTDPAAAAAAAAAWLKADDNAALQWANSVQRPNWAQALPDVPGVWAGTDPTSPAQKVGDKMVHPPAPGADADKMQIAPAPGALPGL